MKTLYVLVAGCLVAARADVTFNLDAELLKTRGPTPLTAGTPIPEGTGLILLVASTLDNVFNEPTPSAFVSGDDRELDRWSVVGNGNGVLFDTTGPLQFSDFPDWGQGDPLRLYWFPELGLSSINPEAGTSYGFYHDPVGKDDIIADNSQPWITPADGTTVDRLLFITMDSMFAAQSTNPDYTGNADLTVVPEPSTYAAAAGLLCLGWAAYTRRSKKGPC